jgi:hypothetical protein
MAWKRASVALAAAAVSWTSAVAVEADGWSSLGSLDRQELVGKAIVAVGELEWESDSEGFKSWFRFSASAGSLNDFCIAEYDMSASGGEATLVLVGEKKQIYLAILEGSTGGVKVDVEPVTIKPCPNRS